MNEKALVTALCARLPGLKVEFRQASNTRMLVITHPARPDAFGRYECSIKDSGWRLPADVLADEIVAHLELRDRRL